MNISEPQIRSLLEMLSLTGNEEADCGECLQHMAEFAETSLPGKPIPEGLRRIEEHLKLCGECREEFEALKDALAGEQCSE